MQSKSLLIAVAAFAVTATGVHAYSGMNLLSKAGLNDDQVEAVQEAQELRAAGDFVAARDRLVAAGITESELHSIHTAKKEAKKAFKEALLAEDFQAFKETIADSPLADIITSEVDFQQFVIAHDLRQAGEWAEADEIMDELGVDRSEHQGKKHYRRIMEGLTAEQQEAVRIARQANDRETVRAIFKEAGVEQHPHHKGW